MSTDVMGISFTAAKIASGTASAVGIPVSSEGPVPKEVGMSRAQLKQLGFEGACCATLVLPPEPRSKQVRILVGVGEAREFTSDKIRNAAAALARAASSFESLETTLATVGRVDKKIAAQSVVEGISLASHRYDALKTKKNGSKLASVTLLASATHFVAVRTGIAAGSVTALAANRARDFANTPPSHLTATQLAEHATAIAKSAGLKITVYDKADLEKMGCGGILGVNAGSVQPPKVIKLVYAPSNPKGKVALIGKGVMYDSGGISLKPTDGMHAMMKMDMSGAAAVLATMGALKALKCRTHVTAFLMCTDNMPSGSAMKLGDVLHMRNGKSVEIHNTDAEGRLILADGLALAAEGKPDAMVDIATLTGACIVALGEDVAGLYSNNEAWGGQLMQSSCRTDEPTWHMPLYKDYRKLLDSSVADMKNIGGPYGGSITAALFLQEFVNDIPWAHLDIAGPMSVNADSGWKNRGATAFGTRLLIDACMNFKKPTKKKA